MSLSQFGRLRFGEWARSIPSYGGVVWCTSCSEELLKVNRGGYRSKQMESYNFSGFARSARLPRST